MIGLSLLISHTFIVYLAPPNNITIDAGNAGNAVADDDDDDLISRAKKIKTLINYAVNRQFMYK